jgi:hypothetical protein
MFPVLVVVYCLVLLFVLYRMIKNYSVRMVENIYLLILTGFLGFVMGIYNDSMKYTVITMLITSVVLITYIMLLIIGKRNKP